jgi:hypothetical protein
MREETLKQKLSDAASKKEEAPLWWIRGLMLYIVVEHFKGGVPYPSIVGFGNAVVWPLKGWAMCRLGWMTSWRGDAIR